MKTLILFLLLFSQVAHATYLGSSVLSSVTSLTNVPASTGAWGDCTSISLTAGEWDVTGIVYVTDNGATFGDDGYIGISTHSGTSSTGLQLGDNEAVIAGSALMDESAINLNAMIPAYRMKLTSTTTVYLKSNFIYTVATPQENCRLSARRVR